jgi:hypothetical protein
LEKDDEGNPILPQLNYYPKREEMKDIIRAMATMAYSELFSNFSN